MSNLGLNRTLADRDMAVLDGGKRCATCPRVKPLHQFYWHSSHRRWSASCKQCARIAQYERDQSPDGKRRRHAYQGLELVRARKRQACRTEAQKQRYREYRRSERGAILNRLGQARLRLKQATTDAQRIRIQALVDRHTAALAALDREMEE